MAAASDVSVVVVDDSPLFRAAAKELVEATCGFAVAALLATGEEAVSWFERRYANLVLMDVHMDGIGGVAAARLLAARAHPPVVVLISADECAEIAAAPAEYGAVAFESKQTLGPQVLTRLWARRSTRGSVAAA